MNEISLDELKVGNWYWVAGGWDDRKPTIYFYAKDASIDNQGHAYEQCFDSDLLNLFKREGHRFWGPIPPPS